MADDADRESARLRALREFRILDTLPEAPFDRIASVAATHYRTPIALISLVDQSRQWFKSRLGLDVCETPREISFCTHAIRSTQAFIVNDASAHEDFRDNPLVLGDPHIRFYAGSPLITASGAAIGTLCVIDHEPRPDFSAADAGVLDALASLVVDELELRLARAKAEAGSRAKTDFIATMSHELRTPLTTVLGFAGLLAETDLDPEQRELLDYIDDSGSHLLRLLNDTLDLARIETGAMKLERENLAPASLIAQAVDLFTDVALRKGLALKIVAAPDPDERFPGDPVRIRQIVYNLLSNAIKFTAEGGVFVSSALTRSGGSRWLTIEVRDTGCGVDPDMQPLIFDRFVQGNGSETREHYGAGLGLAVCRELAGLMDGSVVVESDGISGSLFRVRLCEPS